MLLQYFGAETDYSSCVCVSYIFLPSNSAWSIEQLIHNLIKTEERVSCVFLDQELEVYEQLSTLSKR